METILGRKKELLELEKLFEEYVIVLVTGENGIGKSVLAENFYRRNCQSFPAKIELDITHMDWEQLIEEMYFNFYGGLKSIMNFKQIEKVKFLIEGQEIISLGGHLYLGDAVESDGYRES